MATQKNVTMPSAVTHYSDLDLSFQHPTTANFMEFNVAAGLEIVPKQTIDVDMSTFTRLAPMPVPTMGLADIHNRAYFVPYRTVMRGWNEFINDTTYLSGSGQSLIPNLPMIDNFDFVDTFSLPAFSTQTSTPEDAYDIQIIDSNGSISSRVLTPLGRYFYKVLCTLGYGIFFDARVDTQHSALPLLSLVRVYYDWYYPSAYIDDETSLNFSKVLSYEPQDDYDFATWFEEGGYLYKIAEALYRVAYDSDYFVSAWDNPVSPNAGAHSTISIKDPTGPNGFDHPSTARIQSISSSNGTPYIGTGVYITQYAVDSLKAVSDYLQRNKIAGARTIDRYLARWGVKLPDANINRSMLIGSKDARIQFGDVTSTSDTEGSPLGGYAGKGIGYLAKRNLDEPDMVTFSSTEYGHLIFISTIVPKAAYYQGALRSTLRKDRLDFYTPEYDNLSVQALSTREVFVPQGDYSQGDTHNPIQPDKGVFGFVPMYGDYKVGHDRMTGDYVLGSKNVGQEGWTLMRDLKFWFNGRDADWAEVVHSQAFVDGTDADQYNRIFYITDDKEDKFKVLHNFKINSRFPGKPLYDNYEFKDGDRAAKSTIEVNGVKQN